MKIVAKQILRDGELSVAQRRFMRKLDRNPWYRPGLHGAVGGTKRTLHSLLAKGLVRIGRRGRIVPLVRLK